MESLVQLLLRSEVAHLDFHVSGRADRERGLAAQPRQQRGPRSKQLVPIATLGEALAQGTKGCDCDARLLQLRDEVDLLLARPLDLGELLLSRTERFDQLG